MKLVRITGRSRAVGRRGYLLTLYPMHTRQFRYPFGASKGSRQREERSRSGRSPSHTPSATKLRSSSHSSSKSHESQTMDTPIQFPEPPLDQYSNILHSQGSVPNVSQRVGLRLWEAKKSDGNFARSVYLPLRYRQLSCGR